MTPRVYSSSHGTRRSPCTAAGRHHRSDDVAFTLIEVIGVLGIIAILAAATLPVAIRQIDYANQGTEGTNLVALAAGLTQGASAQRSIPSSNNWATFIASNIGWQATAVSNTVNNPQNLRVFLINPALTIGTNTAAMLPYQQPSNGCSSIPVSPQFIIISSLSSPLPSGLSSGVPANQSDFNALWNTPANAIPTNTTWFSSTSWHGQGSDITIQDINLASSFVHLMLNVSDPTNAPYRIDNYGLASVTNNTPVTNYFLRGTVLNLYYYYYNGTTTTTNLQASQVLQQDSSWWFSGGLWRNTPGSASSSGSGTGTYGPLQSIVQSFVTNAYPSGATVTPSQFYSDMTNYMALYMLYASSGFTYPSVAHQMLETLANTQNSSQGTIHNDMKNLLQTP